MRRWLRHWLGINALAAKAAADEPQRRALHERCDRLEQRVAELEKDRKEGAEEEQATFAGIGEGVTRNERLRKRWGRMMWPDRRG